MKQAWKELVLAAIFAWGIPWLLLAVAGGGSSSPEATTPSTQLQPQKETIMVLMGDTTQEMELTAYLTGVLLGEMPGRFATEAKKAQAVVARTYALRTVVYKDKHPGAVCTDYTCCQGYCSPEEYLQKGGSAIYVAQAKLAVEETAGLVLTYDGMLIDATYFASSGGQTEAALAVWGSDIPYLQSVESPGEESYEHFTDTVSFTPEQLLEALGITLRGQPETWIGGITYTAGGGVDTLHIGGMPYEGTVFRALLGLRSTMFSIEYENGLFSVTTKGFGHRVGMSQYGAQAMALSGCDFQQILQHYYTGTLLKEYHLSH